MINSFWKKKSLFWLFRKKNEKEVAHPYLSDVEVEVLSVDLKCVLRASCRWW
jgi:hypothetical protein